ncbi:MAG: ATP-binding cassette domain-containing protein [Bacteroidales bacterium]|nr:ATP-binding cassette domain-containing protein [Bacteroidales bacterium]
MSERILKALMQLFAIIARPDSNLEERKEVVRNFLRQQLNTTQVNEYLHVFENFYKEYQVEETDSTRKRKKIAGSSVKVLKICTAINEELTSKQKFIVLIRLLEFIKSDTTKVSDLEMEFVETVSDTFNIPHEEFERLKSFVLNDENNIPQTSQLLVIDNNESPPNEKVKHIQSYGFDGKCWVLHVRTSEMYFLRLQSSTELYINSQLIQPYKVHVLSPGSVIKTSKKFKPIYYSDIVSIFKEKGSESKIIFEAKNIEYRFKGGQIGLHKMSFRAESGMLVGIIGASGAGKTTLLNVLNGSYIPSAGDVLINNKSIYDPQNKELEGLIGYVSQDDLLIEDLTVFENLYFNAKLCFDNLSQFQILRLVLKMLQTLGLYEIRHLKVGSPLNKKISGGQRKRLNIALELIREPAILFLDEPTSGLSSRDSENIMDLLKDLALKGKLVFVVIHQPSSDIFKMFDKLLVLDTGGYLVYDGNPVESIIYFKSKTHQANWDMSECPLCGNVNPEQIFNILEAPVLDEYGNPTLNRKITPSEWNNFFISEKKQEEPVVINYQNYSIPQIFFKIPNKLKQFKIFTIRDSLAKLANKQYLILNLLETPLLAFILSFIIRYYNVDISNEWGYTFADNPNIPIYFFMSSIVAIFIGLTVSAEEIFRDRKILKREKYLHLSWGSYLTSKSFILSVISAYQALSFVLIGNTILEVKGMYLEFWLILFITWFSSNLMGLIISEAFNSAVTIYITIPFIVIPQLILSGIVVSFDKLNPDISSPSRIPIYGQLITARWTYEALSTYQFKENAYEKMFYEYDKITSYANFRKDFWARHLQNKIIDIRMYLNNPEKKEYIENALILLKTEIADEIKKNKYVKCNVNLENLKFENINEELLRELELYFNQITRFYIKVFNQASSKKDELINKLQETKEKKDEFIRLKKKHFNEKLKEFVKNETELNKIVEYKNKLYQKADPIFLDPEPGILTAHFYSPRKNLYGIFIDTYWFNFFVIVLMSICFYFAVYYRVLSKILALGELVQEYLKKKLKFLNNNK